MNLVLLFGGEYTNLILNLLLLLKVGIRKLSFDRLAVLNIDLTQLMVYCLIGLSKLLVNGPSMFILDSVHLFFQLFLILFSQCLYRTLHLLSMILLYFLKLCG